MNDDTKVSEITVQDVADYIRLDKYIVEDESDGVEEYSEDDLALLAKLLNIAKQFISNYTGRTEEEMDNYPDFVIVVYILCQDMWDNRTLYVDKTNLNKVVDTILGMHSVNLLPTAELTND